MQASSVGLGLAALSAATFGTSGTFATALMDDGWTSGAAVTVRVAVAALVLTGPALIQLRGRWADLRANLRAVLGYGLFAVVATQLCFFNAVEHLSIGVALLLEYSGALLVVAWVWLRHGQRPRRLTTAGAALAVAGLVLVLDIAGSQHVDAVGVVWGLAAATGLAFYFVISSHGGNPLPPIAMAWAGLSVGAMLLLLAGLVGIVPLHASTADVHLGGHRTSWLLPVAGVSLIATVVAYCAGIGAARRLGARVASFVGLAEVLFAVLIAWALLGQRPSAVQAVGGLVVLAGIALVRADDRDGSVVVEPEPQLETAPASPS